MTVFRQMRYLAASRQVILLSLGVLFFAPSLPSLGTAQGVNEMVSISVLASETYAENLKALPPAVQDRMNSLRAECKKTGSEISLLPLFVGPVDLNNDGAVDFIVDLSASCVDDVKSRCDDDRQCDLEIWMKVAASESYAVAFADRVMGHDVFERAGSVYFVAIYAPQRCNSTYSATASACSATYRGTSSGLSHVPYR